MKTMRIGTVRPPSTPVSLPRSPKGLTAGRSGQIPMGVLLPVALRACPSPTVPVAPDAVSPGAVPTGAILRELRLEPGAHPRIHLTVLHPVHRELRITLVCLPTGVHIEVRCDRPEQLARRWPRMRASHRVRFVRTPGGGPAQARCPPAL